MYNLKYYTQRAGGVCCQNGERKTRDAGEVDEGEQGASRKADRTKTTPSGDNLNPTNTEI